MLLKEGTVPGTSGPPLRSAIILLLPYQELIALGGAKVSGGETPVNVQVFKNNSPEPFFHYDG